ncbi:MAG: hypothetical protein IKU61_03380 [Clostridia bacterium]|nr:hypothetical protein [Clostridia bacterium]
MKRMTERLYEKNAYCSEFEASVVSCTENGGGYDVVLDRTAFFPEGGGQAPDKGTLDGIAVLDVQIRDGVIYHTTEKSIECGKNVVGKLDFALRFSRMQRHSGEHVLSGIVHSIYGYNNVGFHMSEEEMTVDFDGVLSPKDIEKVEKEVNFTLWKNLEIKPFFPTDEEAEKIPYRSKLDITENLRLVEIDGVDVCACCAPHVAKTGEVGIVKIIDATPNKGGTRLTVLAGDVALSDYARLNSANKEMMKTLSVARNDVAEAAKRQVDLLSELRHEASELKCRLAWSELKTTQVGCAKVAFSEKLSYDELRYCSNMLTDAGSEINFLLSTDDYENYIYVISSPTRNIRLIVKSLNDAFDGRGGGRDNYAQGKIVCKETEKIEAFVKEILG